MLSLFIVAVMAHSSVSQCTKDTDCKGDRICVDGACVSPAHVNSGASGGAGIATGVVGLVLSPAPLVLSLVAEANKLELVPTVPSQVSGLSVELLTVPIVAAGGSSSRRAKHTRGVTGLRVSGWVAYGVSLGLGAAMIPFAIAERTPPGGFLCGAGILGTLSMVMHSIDALVSGASTRRVDAGGVCDTWRVSIVSRKQGLGLRLAGPF